MYCEPPLHAAVATCALRTSKMNQGEDAEYRSVEPVMSLLAAVIGDGSLGGAACRAQLTARWLGLGLPSASAPRSSLTCVAAPLLLLQPQLKAYRTSGSRRNPLFSFRMYLQ